MDFLDVFFFAEVTEQKLASPVTLTPSAPSVPEINIQTVSFTVNFTEFSLFNDFLFFFYDFWFLIEECISI